MSHLSFERVTLLVDVRFGRAHASYMNTTNQTTAIETVTSHYSRKGDETARRAVLLDCAKRDLDRLLGAASQGWDVAKEIETARKQIACFA